MKVFAISDLHLSLNNPKPMNIFGSQWDDYTDKIVKNWEEKVGEGDLVLIAGDISWAMAFENALPDLDWIARLKGNKVLLRGNHDYWWKSISSMRAAFPPTVYAVQNDCLRFENVLVCGTRGWTISDDGKPSAEDVKILAREEERMKLTLAAMQKMRGENDRVVLMTHFPPFNTRREPNRFTQLFEDYRVDTVVYGHLHGKKSRADLQIKMRSIDYYLTSCDMADNNLTLVAEV